PFTSLTVIVSCSIGTKAIAVNSQARYRAGGHFKEKAGLLYLMVDDKGSHFQAMISEIFAGYQTPPLTGEVAMANKDWQIWKSVPFS
ncbi:MAG: hypothetical protein AB2660_20960, partial [Candidatus Thiodiazotropha sp.]